MADDTRSDSTLINQLRTLLPQAESVAIIVHMGGNIEHQFDGRWLEAVLEAADVRDLPGETPSAAFDSEGR